MFIDDEAALREWLVATLEPLCDAEPIALARYVLALIGKDKPLDKLRENCIDRLEVFLDRTTKDFVDQLFDVISNRRYIPEGKKENVQPKPSENIVETSEIHQQQTESSSIPATSSSAAIDQPIKRRCSSRHHTIDNHQHQSPSSKHIQHSYSHSPTNSSPSSSPKNTNFPTNKISYPYDHGSNILSLEQQNYYASYQPYDISSLHLHQQYNPEIPDLKYDPHRTSSMFTRQPLSTGQRTLVTVVTNAKPLNSEDKSQQINPNELIHRTKRRITTAPYSTERRIQQRDRTLNTTKQDNYQNRTRKRPWQKADGSGSASTTLEIHKIPVEFNTISKLNEHFSKFGTITNVQIAFNGFSDSALVAYATYQQAETAYKNPEPLFNNRFIKVFWHDPNKKQNQTNTTNSNSSLPSDASSPKKQRTVSNSANHHWTKVQKSLSNKKEISPKKKSTILRPSSTLKKKAIEIRRKKQGLLEEQIQQQKLLLKKLETAETSEEKESIRLLMKQVDSTIIMFKDSFRMIPAKSSSLTTKHKQQDRLKQRAEMLKKQIESLKAKTSVDMRRIMRNTRETEVPNSTQTNDTDVDDDEICLLNEEDQLLSESEKLNNQQYELETQDEVQLLDS